MHRFEQYIQYFQDSFLRFSNIISITWQALVKPLNIGIFHMLDLVVKNFVLSNNQKEISGVFLMKAIFLICRVAAAG